MVATIAQRKALHLKQLRLSTGKSAMLSIGLLKGGIDHTMALIGGHAAIDKALQSSQNGTFRAVTMLGLVDPSSMEVHDKDIVDGRHLGY